MSKNKSEITARCLVELFRGNEPTVDQMIGLLSLNGRYRRTVRDALELLVRLDCAEETEPGRFRYKNDTASPEAKVTATPSTLATSKIMNQNQENIVAGHGQHTCEVPSAIMRPVWMRDGQHEGTIVIRIEPGRFVFAGLDWNEMNVHERCVLVRLRKTEYNECGGEITWEEYLPEDCSYAVDLDLPDGLALIGCGFHAAPGEVGEILWDSFRQSDPAGVVLAAGEDADRVRGYYETVAEAAAAADEELPLEGDVSIWDRAAYDSPGGSTPPLAERIDGKWRGVSVIERKS